MIAHGAGMVEYLKRAFLYRWNLLLFLGGAAAAALSPWPDALLPLLLAAEVAYLGRSWCPGPSFAMRLTRRFTRKHSNPDHGRHAAGSESLTEIVNSLTPCIASAIRSVTLALPGDEVHRAWCGESIRFLLGGFEHTCAGSAALDFSAAPGVPRRHSAVFSAPPMTAKFARESRKQRRN